MIKEQSHKIIKKDVNGLIKRKITGEVNDLDFDLEIIDFSEYGTKAHLAIGEFGALYDHTRGRHTERSDFPDAFKLKVADINKEYSTYFLVQSQITGTEETK